MRNLALLGAVFMIANLALANDAEAAGCGTAEVVKGKVEVKRGAGAAAALVQGTKVCAGDVVTTAADSRVKLAMEDGNVLNVNPGTSMKIESYENDPASAKKKVMLNVMYGKMRATVNQKYDGKSASGEPQQFQVKTRSAVAGVRGTDFLTSFQPTTNKMEVVTFEGKVDVGQAGPGGAIMNAVSVGAGQKTEAAPGQPPAPPKPVPPSELKQMDSSTQEGPAGERPQPNANASNDNKSEKEKGDNKGSDDQAKKGPESDKKSEGDSKKGPEGEKRAEGEPKKGSGNDKNAETEPQKGSQGDGKKGSDSDKRAGNSSGGSSGGRAPAASGPSGGTSGSSAGGAAPKGMPAPGGGMSMPIDSDMMAGGPTMPSAGPALPPVFVPPTMPIFQLPVCEFCNQVIQTGPARVNVKICLPNQGC